MKASYSSSFSLPASSHWSGIFLLMGLKSFVLELLVSLPTWANKSFTSGKKFIRRILRRYLKNTTKLLYFRIIGKSTFWTKDTDYLIVTYLHIRIIKERVSTKFSYKYFYQNINFNVILCIHILHNTYVLHKPRILN